MTLRLESRVPCVLGCLSTRWLTFIRGVVDSDELPLNVGREILQKSRMLQVINKRIAAKSVEMMKNMKKEGGDKWRRFWENYGKYIKVWPHSGLFRETRPPYSPTKPR